LDQKKHHNTTTTGIIVHAEAALREVRGLQCPPSATQQLLSIKKPEKLLLPGGPCSTASELVACQHAAQEVQHVLMTLKRTLVHSCMRHSQLQQK
jgi:hypothetical protein